MTGAYSVVFGSLMLLFGAIADRFGRRRLMLLGLLLLAAAGLATAVVTTTEGLVAVRAVMGVAAAMTTPGSAALASRLFDDDGLRVTAISLISTIGIVGLAVGPLAGGAVLAVAPWRVLLLVNVPVALLAALAIRLGIAADDPHRLHRAPIDVLGALLGTSAIVLALLAPTLLLDDGVGSVTPWAALAGALLALALFVWRERTARHPLLELRLLAQRSPPGAGAPRRPRSSTRPRPRPCSPWRSSPPCSSSSAPCTPAPADPAASRPCGTRMDPGAGREENVRIGLRERSPRFDRIRARHHLRGLHARAVRPRRPDREGGGATVTFFAILAAALAVAAIVYLVVALVAPERF
ncbi:MFS transporter [uncultured Microbacterium sp.]|uniref:MFS transporter n=1 Tax=uncultured Microbacterium sp. TaxID=191216 RepID=UPI0025F3A7D9|nr:MFS transporter [uncultured Microbacterium sp.]